MSGHDHDHHGDDHWRHHGVQVVKGDRLDPNTAQTPGMFRQAAINHTRVGAQKIWAGTVHIHANAKTGAHHHGPLESVIYVLKGRARMRWGETLECLLVRSDNEAVVVNLDIEPVERPEHVPWVDPIHKAPPPA